ncbi:MAG: Calx-beta domain-containing protein [Deltaproteobacteria bacterium]
MTSSKRKIRRFQQTGLALALISMLSLAVSTDAGAAAAKPPLGGALGSPLAGTYDFSKTEKMLAPMAKKGADSRPDRPAGNFADAKSPVSKPSQGILTDPTKPVARWTVGELSASAPVDNEAALRAAFASYIAREGAVVGVTSLDGLVAQPVRRSPYGAAVLRYQQMIGKVSVLGRGVSVYFDPQGTLRGVAANLAEQTGVKKARLSRSAAEKRVAGEVYSAELVVDPTAGLRMAWRIDHDEEGGTRSMVDAVTGEVYGSRSLSMHIIARGRDLDGNIRRVAAALRNQVPRMNVEARELAADLARYPRGPVNLVRSGNGGLADVFTLDAARQEYVSSRSGSFRATTRNRIAITVHDNLVQSVDHVARSYLGRRGLASFANFNGRPASVVAMVEVPDEWGARWDTLSKRILIGADRAPNRFPGLRHFANGLDVMAHEYGHAIAATNTSLDYAGIGGGLHEGFADIVGFLVEADFNMRNGRPIEWSIAEDAYDPEIAPFGVRYLKDPHVMGMPDSLNSPYFTDDIGPHAMGAILGKVFHLLVEGGVHYGVPVRPLHPQARNGASGHAAARLLAGKVFFEWMLMDVMPQNATFADARRAMELAVVNVLAAENPRQVSFGLLSVANAWASVGVGEPGTGGGCLLPYTQDFELGLDGCWDTSGFAEVTPALNHRGGLELSIFDVAPMLPEVVSSASVHLSAPREPGEYFAAFHLKNFPGSDPREQPGELHLSVDGGPAVPVSQLVVADPVRGERHFVHLEHPAIEAGLASYLTLTFRRDCVIGECGIIIDDLVVGTAGDVAFLQDEDPLREIALRLVRLEISPDRVREDDPAEPNADGPGFWISIVRDEPFSDSETFIVSLTGAQAGTDYQVAFDPRVTLVPGESVKRLFVAVLDDELYEYDETLQVSLQQVFPSVLDQEPWLVEVPGARATMVIESDDAPPIVRIATDDRDIRETSGSAGRTPIHVDLDSISGEDVTINFSFDGDAARGADYNMARQLTIPAGQTEANLGFSGRSDNIYEDNETAIIGIRRVEGGVVTDAVAGQEVRITLLDAAGVELRMWEPDTEEVDALRLEERGGNSVWLEVELSCRPLGRSLGRVVVHLDKDGDARVEADYRGLPNRFVFDEEAGSCGAKLFTRITIVDDNIYELDKTLEISVREIEGFARDYDDFVFRIDLINDDPMPTVSIDRNRTTTEMHEGGSYNIFFLTSHPSELPIQVRLLRDPSSTAEASDYRAPEAIDLAISGPNWSQIFVANDDLDEPTERLHLYIEPNNIHTRTDSTRFSRDIIDTPTVVGLRASRGRVPFGETYTVTAEVSHASRVSRFVVFCANIGVDSHCADRYTVVLAPGETSTQISTRNNSRVARNVNYQWWVGVQSGQAVYAGRFGSENRLGVIHEPEPEPEPSCRSSVPPARPGYREGFDNPSLPNWSFIDDRNEGGWHRVMDSELVLNGTGDAEQSATLHVDFSGRTSGQMRWGWGNFSTYFGFVEVSLDGRSWTQLDAIRANDLILGAAVIQNAQVAIPRNKLGPCTQIRFSVTSDAGYGMAIDNIRID